MVVSIAPAPALLDTRGQRVALGSQLARGGEGAIFPVTGRPDLVAKVYHAPVPHEKADKLAAMVQLASARLGGIAAWPVETLREHGGGPVRGILMPLVRDHHEVHTLYGPKSRLRAFPDADFRFLLHTALNLARAFAVIHEHGHVIGDVNHGSVLVSQRGTVMLVDCDSFQIAHNGRHFLCTVGMPTHTPPELQGKSFANLLRAPDHDAFGLAVLLFQLLFAGRHPFAGTSLDNRDLSLEQSITEYRFAYGAGAASRSMRQPPFTPPLELATPRVAALFERAFARAGSDASGRPGAREWIDALTDAGKQLVACRQHSGHYYPRTLGACPWCPIESAVGFALFNLVATALPSHHARVLQAVHDPGANPANPGPVFRLDAIWAQILAVPDPGPPPLLPLPSILPAAPSAAAVAASPETRRMAMIMKGTLVLGGVDTLLVFAFSGSVAGVALGLVALVCYIIGGVAYRRRQQHPARQAALYERDTARRRIKDLDQQWRANAGNAAFVALRVELDRQRQAYLALPETRQRRLNELTANARQRQFQQYLESQRIISASIPNIGPSRTATLQSYGIWTAADVNRTALLRVPGFGPTLTSYLLGWRSWVESQFMFDPLTAMSRTELAAVDRELGAQRACLEQALSQGAAQLQHAAQQAISIRPNIGTAHEQARLALAQAEADLRAT